MADRGGMQLYVYASRHESPDQADAFAARVGAGCHQRTRASWWPTSTPTATALGRGCRLVEGLRTRKLLPRLYSYACLDQRSRTRSARRSPMGCCSHSPSTRSRPPRRTSALRVAAAQVKVLLHRLVNDFLYEGVVRGQVTEDFIRPRGLNPRRLDESGRAPRRAAPGRRAQAAGREPHRGLHRPALAPARPRAAGRIARRVDRQGHRGVRGRAAVGPDVGSRDRLWLSAVSSRSQPRPPAPRVLQ